MTDKSIFIYNGAYEVFADGRVISHKRKNAVELVGKVSDTGYRMIILTIDKRKKYVNVHRLVAQCFIPSPNDLPEVNHKDCNKQNNRVENLEWVTSSQNQKHAIAHARSSRLKLNMPKANEIRDLYKTGKYSHKQLADMYGVRKTVIGYIIQNKRWAQ